MAEGRAHVAPLLQKHRRPAMEIDAPEWVAPAEVGLEQAPDEAVVAHRAGLAVDDLEQRPPAEERPHRLRGIRAHEVDAHRWVERLEHRQTQRRVALRVGHRRQDLGGEVSGQRAVGTRPLRVLEVADRRVPSGHQRQPHCDRPTVERVVEGDDRLCVDVGRSTSAREFERLRVGQSQRVAADLVHPARAPPPPDRKIGIDLGGDDEVQSIVCPIDEEREPVEGAAVELAVEPVEDQHDRVGRVELGDQRDQEQTVVGSAFAQQHLGFVVDGRAHRSDAGDDVAPEHGRVLVERVDVDPRHGRFELVDPLADADGLAHAGHRRHERERPQPTELGEHPLPRDVGVVESERREFARDDPHRPTRSHPANVPPRQTA